MFALIIESFHPAKPIVCPREACRSARVKPIGFPWATDSKDLMFESAVPYIHPSSSFSF